MIHIQVLKNTLNLLENLVLVHGVENKTMAIILPLLLLLLLQLLLEVYHHLMNHKKFLKFLQV